jgi:integrase
MSRKVGQIIARGERRWLVRVYLGRDRETRRRAYHNRTIYGFLRNAQAYLTRRLHERDLSRGVEGLQVTVDEFLDHWLKTAVKPKVRGKTYSDYAAMLRRYIRPAIGTTVLASLSALEIQAAYQVMIERKLSARTVRYAHAVLRAAMRQAIRWQLLLADPTQGVQLPSQQCGEMRVLSTEQARSFLRTASHSPQACLFAVALTTGMRPSEYPSPSAGGTSTGIVEPSVSFELFTGMKGNGPLRTRSGSAVVESLNCKCGCLIYSGS